MQLITTLLPAFSIVSGALAQSSLKWSSFTDDNDIEFQNVNINSDVGSGDAQFGVVLPPADATDVADEYIGRLVVPIPESGTWFGLAHSSGMTNNLILLAWPNGEDVMTDFRYATGYTSPSRYDGNATLSKISSSVNETHFELTYRCEHCWVWNLEGTDGNKIPSTTEGARQILGWGQAAAGPSDPTDAGSAIEQHASANMLAFPIVDARNPAYTDYTSLASAPESPAPTGTSGGNSTTSAVPSSTAVPTAACPSSGQASANTTYDYIIVGSGAGGIPAAAKLAESGKKVLLIERGPASSARHGGTMRPDWLVGSNQTRFDVPGLSNEIWAHSDGIACTDYSIMAGCVLGGGTAVNAGLWWNPTPLDFDDNFPEGWKYADIEPAIQRAFEKIPYNEHPSMDGKLYRPQGYNVVAGALEAAGWKNVSAGAQPDEKNLTYSLPNHMFAHGERGGPMATYLVDAKELPNFTLMVNTTVNRVIRDGSDATGVEVEAFLPGGQCGNINLSSGGKVILSAGTFGSPKILFRSGIGPQDQLENVQKAEGDAMIDEAQWINLPVGENLDDHANTEIVITHPDVSLYDYYGAFQNPIASDSEAYLEDRTGILTQAGANLGAVFWHDSVGPDGISRTSQWTSRVESSHGIKGNNTISLSHYLGRGKTSRGRTTISTGLNMVVAETPYINNDDDLAATKDAISTVLAALKANEQVKVVFPSGNTTLDDYLADYSQTTGSRSANHWMGTCKMGTDSGLEADGTAVVDTDTKVYGMDNLFVVDASIFPGMITTNPSALIVSVAEHAVEKIMAVEGGSTGSSSNSTTVQGVKNSTGAVTPVVEKESTASAGNSTGSAAPSGSAAQEPAVSSAPANNATSAAPAPTGTAAAETQNPTASVTVEDTAPTSAAAAATPSASSAGSSSDSGAVAQKWQQCGGNADYSGPTTCAEGSTCKHWSDYYSQCV